MIGGRAVSLREASHSIVADSRPDNDGLRDIVLTYLRAGDDIAAIQRAISERDRSLAPGLASFEGLRLVKTDEWECLVSYILATYANVPRISKMVSSLASAYGKRIDSEFNAFPTMRRLREASVEDLERCGLGYRARYVHDLCQQVDARRIESMRRLGYDDLREELLGFPGVGNKVADCVALFGFGKLESFPIDVWIERALARMYGIRGSYRELREFAQDRFGPYAGYAQEYLYHNERELSRSGTCRFMRRGGSSDRIP